MKRRALIEKLSGQSLVTNHYECLSAKVQT
jgi:hypothetical protein